MNIVDNIIQLELQDYQPLKEQIENQEDDLYNQERNKKAKKLFRKLTGKEEYDDDSSDEEDEELKEHQRRIDFTHFPDYRFCCGCFSLKAAFKLIFWVSNLCWIAQSALIWADYKYAN